MKTVEEMQRLNAAIWRAADMQLTHSDQFRVEQAQTLQASYQEVVSYSGPMSKEQIKYKAFIEDAWQTLQSQIRGAEIANAAVSKQAPRPNF